MVKIMEGLKKVGGWLFSGRGQNPEQNKKNFTLKICFRSF